MKHKKIIFIVILLLAGLTSAATLKAPLFSYQIYNTATVVKDSEVPFLSIAYSDLSSEAFKGKIKGHIKSNALITAKEVILCSITQGQVLQLEKYRVLKCNNSAIKTSVITLDNYFEFSLNSGFYFLDIPELKSRPTNDLLPAKVSVHKGQLGTLEINLD